MRRPARTWETSASNSHTAVGAGGGGTINWVAACASNSETCSALLQQCSPPASLSASNLTNHFSARSTNPLHSCQKFLLCCNSCCAECLPDCIDLCSSGALENLQHFLQLGNLPASCCHEGIWRRGKSVAQGASSLPPWHVATKPRAQLEWHAPRDKEFSELLRDWAPCSWPRENLWAVHLQQSHLRQTRTCNAPFEQKLPVHEMRHP